MRLTRFLTMILAGSLLAMLSACNLPLGSAVPATPKPQSSGPALVQPQGGQPPVQLGEQSPPTPYAQLLTPTAASQNAFQPPPPPGGGSTSQPTSPPASGGNSSGNSTAPTPPPSGGSSNTLQITRVEALPMPIYYGTCKNGEPTTLRVKAWLNDPNLALQVQVEWEYPAAPSAPGQSVLMTPGSNGVYAIDLDQFTLGAEARLQGGSGDAVVTVSAYDQQQNYVAANPVRVMVKPCAPGSSSAPPVTVTPTITATPTAGLITVSNYVEITNFSFSEDTAELDGSGGPGEMYFDVDEFPQVGQHGGRGTNFAFWGTAPPTYEDCRWIPTYGGIEIALGNYYCYRTDEGNPGYFRVDRLEEFPGEISYWVLGITYSTWKQP